MIGEIEIGGVFLPVALVAGAIAFVLSLLVRHIFRAANVYAVVWHAGLFDVAMFVILWWLVSGLGAVWI